ncbi:hypothetical protein ACSN7A_003191 [Yersinia ruckeri]
MMDITKSREEFEKWAEEAGALPWGYLKKQRTPSGGYSVQVYQYMWTAWKASRESVDIKLPELFEDDLHAVTDAIRAAGIRIKGESE